MTVSPGLKAGAAWARVTIPDAANREKDDFYPTPPEGTRALLCVEKFDGPIWEPACGDGAIVNVLRDAGYEVIATDLVDRGCGESRIDFLMEHRSLAPDIVTNPPFKYVEAFIAKALELTTGKVAMLARLALLEGAARREMFESTPLARVWVFSRRLAISRSGEVWRSKQGGMVAFAWFVWDHAHKGPPTLGWIEPVHADPVLPRQDFSVADLPILKAIAEAAE
jgi:hypothetical protein